MPARSSASAASTACISAGLGAWGVGGSGVGLGLLGRGPGWGQGAEAARHWGRAPTHSSPAAPGPSAPLYCLNPRGLFQQIEDVLILLTRGLGHTHLAGAVR